MASTRQIEANRRNALLSCGPRTMKGIARSRANSHKHGLSTPVADTSEGWSKIVAVQQLLSLDGDPQLSPDILWAMAELHAALHRIRRAQCSILSQGFVSASDLQKGVVKAISLDRYAKAAFAKRASAIKADKLG